MKTSSRNDINVQNINIRVNIDIDIYQYSTHTIEPWLTHNSNALAKAKRRLVLLREAADDFFACFFATTPGFGQQIEISFKKYLTLFLLCA